MGGARAQEAHSVAPEKILLLLRDHILVGATAEFHVVENSCSLLGLSNLLL